MAANTLSQSFGLSYLNEQQRFKRVETQVYAGKKAQPSISDMIGQRQHRPNFQYAKPVTQPILSARVQNVAPVIPAVVLKPAIAVPLQLAEASHFSDQFQSQDEPVAEHGKLKRFLPLVIATIALLTGLTVLGLSLHQNHQAAAQVAAITEKAKGTSNTDDAPPSEAPVSAAAVGSYSVAPGMPRIITIKKIKVNARILPVGILGSGAMGTPKNTNDAGWYNGSSKPGENGAVTILGHVSGAVHAGVFYDLKKLGAGDVINVERGDGQKFTYKVIKTTQMPSEQVDMSSLLVPVTAGKGGLNLITCGGTYDAKTETFDKRMVVYAEQV